jgi:hypothetical protein
MKFGCNCGRQWTGLAQAHCCTCHEHFGSVAGFDRHRSSGRCQDPAHITTRAGRRVFRSAESPFGGTWVLDTDRVHPAHARRLAEQEGAA